MASIGTKLYQSPNFPFFRHLRIYVLHCQGHVRTKCCFVTSKLSLDSVESVNFWQKWEGLSHYCQDNFCQNNDAQAHHTTLLNNLKIVWIVVANLYHCQFAHQMQINVLPDEATKKELQTRKKKSWPTPKIAPKYDNHVSCIVRW